MRFWRSGRRGLRIGEGRCWLRRGAWWAAKNWGRLFIRRRRVSAAAETGRSTSTAAVDSCAQEADIEQALSGRPDTASQMLGYTAR